MRLVCVSAALVLTVLGCGDDPPAATTTTPTTISETDTTEPDVDDDVAVDPEPAVGAWLGTRELGTGDNDSLYGAIAMANGDVVVVGAAATPGEGAAGSRWLVHRMSPSGAVRWSAGGLRGAATRGTPGPDDSVIVVGQYNVARYDADGSERWHALDDLWVNDVGIDLEGRVVVAGLYAGGPFLADATLRPAIGQTGGSYDGFVMRLDPDDGHILDRVQVGTNGSDWVNGLAVGPEGGVYLTGPTEGTFPHATHVGTDGNSYVMRLTPDLVLDWATQLNDGFDQGYAVRFDVNTDQLAVLTGHGLGLTRVDAITGASISSLYVADVAGSDLAIDAASRVWFVGSTHQGPAFGMVTVIDPDDHIADPLWFTDSPSQGISTVPSLHGNSDAHSFGVAVDAKGWAWITGDALGDLEQGQNATTRSAGNLVDPGTDGTVARVSPDLVRDRPRFVIDALAPLTIGQAATLTLHIEDGSGQPIVPPAHSLAWTSALPEVASVSSDGVVTAKSGGKTRIQVALGPAHSEPLEVVVEDPSHPERGSVLLIGADHGDVGTVVVADPLATSDPGAVLVGGWTDGPLAHSDDVPPELADYDVMLGQRDAFIAEVGGDGTIHRMLQLGGAVYDVIRQIIPMPDGSLLVRADLSAPRGINFGRSLIARIDRDGHERWHFPDEHQPGDQQFPGLSMSLLESGHILVSGQQASMTLVELDPDTGAELWRWIAEGHVQGGAGGVGMRQAGVRPDGTYVIIGDDAPPWRTWMLGLDPAQTEPIFGGPKILFYGNVSPQVGIVPGMLAVAPAGVASGEFAAAKGWSYSFNQDGSGYVQTRGASIVTFDASGALKWEGAPTVEGAAELTIGGLVFDASGAMYVAGTRSTAATTLAGQLNEFDAFVAKLDRDGATEWVQLVAGPANDYGNALALTANGDVALVGYTYGSIDGTALHGAHAKESCDAFLARFSADGARR